MICCIGEGLHMMSKLSLKLFKNLYNKANYIIRQEFIENGKYLYDKVLYVTTDTPVIIMCKIHNEFNQIHHMHLVGHECKKCYKQLQSHSKEVFIERSIKKHGNIYYY